MVQKIRKENTIVCIVGLGYVGLPLAIKFGKAGVKTIGFDVNKDKINQLSKGVDFMQEFKKSEIRQDNIYYTYDAADISLADFIIVAVPTPVTKDSNPDLSFVKSASKIVGKNMEEGATVVFESTVYPGVTEDVCQPILEKHSKMRCGLDFSIGYSPERINPGDKKHTIENIVKIVSGCDRRTVERIAQVYEWVVKAGVYKAKNIKTAEAAKVIENVQRDLNIALMNELSLIFERIGLSTADVINAAATKWNFHKYSPGLVGGHCIPVDPYYLVHEAKKAGYKPKVILAGRAINDSMPEYVGAQVAKQLKISGKKLGKSKAMIMGLTFKENVNDIRTSPAKKIIKALKAKGIKVIGYDPLIDPKVIRREFNIGCITKFDASGADALIVTVPHRQFKRIKLKTVRKQMRDSPIIFDIKGLFKQKEAEKLGFMYNQL